MTPKPTDREALRKLIDVGDAVVSELVTHEARDSVGGLCGTARNVTAAWNDASRAAKEVLAREPEVVAYKCEAIRTHIHLIHEVGRCISHGCGRPVHPLRYADE